MTDIDNRAVIVDRLIGLVESSIGLIEGLSARVDKQGEELKALKAQSQLLASSVSDLDHRTVGSMLIGGHTKFDNDDDPEHFPYDPPFRR